jgi:hypothetical protein
MAVSVERIQQQVRAVFQSMLPGSLDDCDSDTLYLTLRLHQKKVVFQFSRQRRLPSCTIIVHLIQILAAKFSLQVLANYLLQTPHPFLAPSLHSKLATVLASSVSCHPALHPVWPLIISNCSSSKHDGNVSKEGVTALLSLWSKGDD